MTWQGAVVGQKPVDSRDLPLSLKTVYLSLKTLRKLKQGHEWVVSV